MLGKFHTLSIGLVFAVLTSVGMSLTAPAANAEVMTTYREVFPNKDRVGIDNIALSTADWYSYKDNGVSADGGIGGGYVYISQYSSGSSAEPVDSNPDPSYHESRNPRGYLVFLGISGVDLLHYTEEYQVSTDDAERFRWRQTRPNTTDVFRVALRVDDGVDSGWYVSEQTLSNDVASTWEQKELDFDTASWLALDFDPSTPSLALGTAATLPDGQITAFGLYGDNTSNGVHGVDDFEVGAVPEPGSIALGLTGLVSVLVWPALRRRFA